MNSARSGAWSGLCVHQHTFPSFCRTAACQDLLRQCTVEIRRQKTTFWCQFPQGGGEIHGRFCRPLTPVLEVQAGTGDAGWAVEVLFHCGLEGCMSRRDLFIHLQNDWVTPKLMQAFRAQKTEKEHVFRFVVKRFTAFDFHQRQVTVVGHDPCGKRYGRVPSMLQKGLRLGNL